MPSLPPPLESIKSSLVIPFSDREIELAHQMRALGLMRDPVAGMFVYDDGDISHNPPPSQEHIFVLRDVDASARHVGGMEKLLIRFIWLPTFEESFAWLRTSGKSEAEILDRIREMVVDTGLAVRESFYELIVAALHGRRTPPSP